MSTDDVIDDVMNVICTDKNGKVIENLEDIDNNPLLIDKLNIPEKTGDTPKDQAGQ